MEVKTEEALVLAKQNETEIDNINKDYNEFKNHCNPKGRRPYSNYHG